MATATWIGMLHSTHARRERLSARSLLTANAMPRALGRALVVALSSLIPTSIATAPGCAAADGCMSGDDGTCVPRSACQRLSYSCEDVTLILKVIAGPEERPSGPHALGATGDFLLASSRLTAVIDGLDARHYLSPSGGSLLDLQPQGAASADQLNQAFQAVGILPRDAARYHSVDRIESSGAVALVFRGHLDGRPEMDLVTRYELRACEPGLRIRSEVHHGGREPMAVFLSDAWFWGDRGVAPFAPLRGQGFLHPELDLETLGDAFRDVPFLAAASPGPPRAAYAVVDCERPRLSSFSSETLSAGGAPRRVLMPGDSVAFERFVMASGELGQAGAVGLALEARRQLFGEPWVRVSGRVLEANAAPVGGDERRVGLLFYEPATSGDPDAPGARTPWSETVPAADGSFTVALPARRAFRAEAHVLGRPLPARFAFSTTGSDTQLADWSIPAVSRLDVTVTAKGGAPLASELVLVPAAPTEPEAVSGSVYGVFDEERCAPYLGPPHGASPACNRALIGPAGKTSLLVPPGHFHVYATRGPFWTLAHEKLSLAEGEERALALELSPLDLRPAGALSADFHVHAGASFDSSLPEHDRALSFVAAGVDVIAATDHDVVTSYATALAALGIADEVRVLPGVETTGQILFLEPPGADIPKVVGHYNFWPLRHDPGLPRNGAPDDERLEPGALFDRMQSYFDGSGVMQLNHPFGDAELGRDTGYLKAVGYDPRKPIPEQPNDTAAGQLVKRPGGGHSNLDHHAQEVMNGHDVEQHLRYRAGWFSFLNQGVVRAGTANSDSHTLAIEVLGYPRNLVFGGHSVADFDRERFDADVRAGRMLGTNGPVLTACIDDGSGGCRGPSLEAFAPEPGALVRVRVVAAPWIPVEEVRFVVNGTVRKVLPVTTTPTDPFGSQHTLRLEAVLSLAELVSELAGDAWMVIEAGAPFPPNEDSDDDGLPDLKQKVARPSEGDSRFHYDAVVPGALPSAFTNPFLLDLDTGGWKAPGLK